METCEEPSRTITFSRLRINVINTPPAEFLVLFGPCASTERTEPTERRRDLGSTLMVLPKTSSAHPHHSGPTSLYNETMQALCADMENSSGGVIFTS